MILKNAVQPRMDTDGHGYQTFARNNEITQQASLTQIQKSVCIRVHPWLMISSSVFNCRIQDNPDMNTIPPQPRT